MGTPGNRSARHADLVRIAAAEIDWLSDQTPGTRYSLVLAEGGSVLYSKPAAVPSRPSSPTGLACSTISILDPFGFAAAALEAVTVYALAGRGVPEHVAACASLAARRIERSLFLDRFQQGIVLCFQVRPERESPHDDGALALAGDATVIAADAAAARLLGFGSRHDLIGRRIDEIFAVRPDELIDSPHVARWAPQPVRDALFGRQFFVSLSRGATGIRQAPAGPGLLDSNPVLQLEPAAGRTSALTLEELAGDDPQMLRNVRSARRIAASRVPVMIQGPTGSGKEAFARALHDASDRASQPFVALNCAAIPESLIESELFGYRSGAFTGARKEGMRGKVLQSSGGTLFLDEIGDMPVELQTRLLRVLEEQKVVPLGAETPIRVDLRVLSASHQNLRAMISRGLFREDLYYRLNGITLELPPLAQRTDKEQLIRQFLAEETSDGRPVAIEMDAFQCLLAYGWPGNIRQLRNVIRTALAICDGGVVRLKDLPSEVRDGADLPRNTAFSTLVGRADPGGPLETAERRALMQIIHDSGDNMSRAAKILGISRNTLYRRCKRLGLPLRGAHGDPA